MRQGWLATAVAVACTVAAAAAAVDGAHAADAPAARRTLHAWPDVGLWNVRLVGWPDGHRSCHVSYGPAAEAGGRRAILGLVFVKDAASLSLSEQGPARGAVEALRISAPALASHSLSVRQRPSAAGATTYVASMGEDRDATGLLAAMDKGGDLQVAAGAAVLHVPLDQFAAVHRQLDTCQQEALSLLGIAPPPATALVASVRPEAVGRIGGSQAVASLAPTPPTGPAGKPAPASQPAPAGDGARPQGSDLELSVRAVNRRYAEGGLASVEALARECYSTVPYKTTWNEALICLVMDEAGYQLAQSLAPSGQELLEGYFTRRGASLRQEDLARRAKGRRGDLQTQLQDLRDEVQRVRSTQSRP